MKKNLHQRLCVLGLAFLWVFLVCPPDPLYPHAVSANFFPIAVWMETSPEIMGYDASTAHTFFDESFKKIVSFGFNTVRPSNLPHQNRQIVSEFLTLAQAYNLMVILDPGEGHNLMKYSATHLQTNRNMWLDYLDLNVIDRYYNYPNLLGYAVIDEPSVYPIRDENNNLIPVSKEEKLARWGLIVGMLDELDTEHHDYTVFTDPTWLSYAMDTFASKGIAYDNYPFEAAVSDYVMGPADAYNWFTRLQGFNEACQVQYTVPQIAVVQTFEDSIVPYRFPKPEELRTCVYTSLAAGARGIMYFIFMDMNLPDGHYAHGLVDASFHTHNSALLKAVVTLNQELQVLGPLIALMRSSKEGKVSGWESAAPVLAGTYNNLLGIRYYNIANKDPHPDHAPITYTLQLPASDYYVTDKYSNEKFYADASGQAQIVLAPAQGRVLRESNLRPITVTSPQKSARWFKGSTYPINWYSTGLQGDLSLQLYSPSGQLTITASHPYNVLPYNYQVPLGIEPGTYYIQISQGNFSAQSEPFLIVEPSTTAIEVDQTRMEFSGIPGEVLTSSFRVRHTGKGKLNYTVTDDMPWIFVYPTMGSSSGEYDTITVSIGITRLTVGLTYHGTITVSSHEVAPKTIAVQLQVIYHRTPSIANPVLMQ